MPPEGPPEAPEKKEQEPITEEQAMEAMRTGLFEVVRSWHQQEEEKNDENPSGDGRVVLEFRLASMQLRAGFTEEGTESIRAALFAAEGQGLQEVAQTILGAMEKLGIERE